MKIDRVQTVFIVIGYFVGFEKYGIDVFYNRKYQKWLAENSTDAEYLNSENSFEFDEAGFITNITFTPFENGIPLTESVYIEEQKKYLDGILKLTDVTKSEKRKIEYFINYLNDKKENLKVGGVPKKQKIKTFKEFFNADVSDKVIQKIQTEFKDYSGKKLAFLIYLLHKENRLIDYSINSRLEARKYFIVGLTGKANIVAGVNKFFNLNDVTLVDPKFENDNDYSTIKEKLLETIKKIVV